MAREILSGDLNYSPVAVPTACQTDNRLMTKPTMPVESQASVRSKRISRVACDNAQKSDLATTDCCLGQSLGNV